eukprot:1388580-Heterocapsa_arctica.AAC.1
MLRQPITIDARWKIGGQAMLAALKDVMTCGIADQALLEAYDQELPGMFEKCKSLKAIYHAAGRKGLDAVATRVLPRLA